MVVVVGNGGTATWSIMEVRTAVTAIDAARLRSWRQHTEGRNMWNEAGLREVRGNLT
jgi:hypothetical protein